jgi:hypothetical protein
MPLKAQDGNHERLLRAMAEELKLPLVQIARQAELLQTAPSQKLHESIETAANHAIWFVDSFLLSQQLAQQTTLELEPVTVSAALHDAAHLLQGLARQYDCNIELRLSGRYGPVMAHKQALQSALVGLGSTLITAAHKGKQTFVLGAHNTRNGVVAGVFTSDDTLSQTLYQQGKSLYGQARQPLQSLTAQPGAGIFIADSLFASMEAQLRVARHNKLTGLAATLHPSHQLALI